MITVVEQHIGIWNLSVVVFSNEARRILIPVHAIIGNSITTSSKGKNTSLDWKRAVASAAKKARGPKPLEPSAVYSISGGFAFHPRSHANRTLDVENYLKPAFDGLAAGLFCDNDEDCHSLSRFAYDDSGFRYLFAYRLPDASAASEEGVAIVVSVSS
jgi:hypothetical protein